MASASETFPRAGRVINQVTNAPASFAFPAIPTVSHVITEILILANFSAATLISVTVGINSNTVNALAAFFDSLVSPNVGEFSWTGEIIDVAGSATVINITPSIPAGDTLAYNFTHYAI